MKTRANRLTTLWFGALFAVGCAADMGDNGQIQNSTEEIRCGGTTCRLDNATATCHRGGCVIANCFTFNADCDHRDANGCEVNIGTAVNNCGSCGTRCPARANATRTCTVGACGFSCNPGFADCDHNAANGCEVNLNTSLTNCGTCGTSCGPVMGPMGGACCAGRCTSTQYDPNNCGGCGIVCASGPNGSPACNYPGTCTLYCNYPYVDCDRNAANGCEANVYGNDSNNCGGCGIVCSAGTTCQGGSCAPTCTPTQTLCRGPMPPFLVCTDVSSDPANCGGCGFACAPGGTCTGGACTGGCAPGFSDCDRNPMNGCETNVSSDNGNCGFCGNVCASGTTCVGAMCAAPPMCPPPLATCGPICADLQSDQNNCGACGNVCRPGTLCTMGACR